MHKATVVQFEITGADRQTTPAIDSVCGHLSLFGLEPSFMEQIDLHLQELLATPA
jgi:hypothetical protein